MSPPPLRGAAGGQAAPASNYLGGPVSEAVTDGGEGSTVRCAPCGERSRHLGAPPARPGFTCVVHKPARVSCRLLDTSRTYRGAAASRTTSAQRGQFDANLWARPLLSAGRGFPVPSPHSQMTSVLQRKSLKEQGNLNGSDAHFVTLSSGLSYLTL